jgi:uncharacterized protein YbjQ (UPF0145 family)
MFEVGSFIVLFVVGYLYGSLVEKRHFMNIIKREKELVSLPLVMLKQPLDSQSVVESKLVHGSVVVSIDFFKKIVALLVNFFGGSVATYETLIDRARREAILRLKEDAKGASEIINLRLETTAISNTTKKSIGTVEVFAYATAIYK